MTSIVSNASAKSVKLSVAPISNLSTLSLCELQSLNEAQLVAAVVAGNAYAFHVLDTRYRPVLMRFLMSKVHDYDVARELAQETIMSAWNSICKGNYSDDRKLGNWLKTIASNKHFDYCRKSKRNPMADQLFESSGSEYNNDYEPIDPIDDVMKKEELLQAVENFVEKLPEKQREVIKLRLQGLSFSQIADMLKVSINTVLGRGHNAVESLRKMLREVA